MQLLHLYCKRIRKLKPFYPYHIAHKKKPCVFRLPKIKDSAEFPNIPQLIAKNTLQFGQIMYVNLSDLIQSRTRSSRCTYVLLKTIQQLDPACNINVPWLSCLACNLLSTSLQLICAIKYNTSKQKILTDFNLLSHFSSTLHRLVFCKACSKVTFNVQNLLYIL